MRLEDRTVEYRDPVEEDDFGTDADLDDLDFEEESDGPDLDREVLQFLAERRS